MQDGIEADFFLDGFVGFGFESYQQIFLFVFVKSIYNFVCKPNKPVDVEDGSTQRLMQ
jgi:hypothetical protein